MSAKAILFDLDGTLIDSESIHFESWNEVLSAFSIELNYDHYIKEYAGVSLPANAEKLVSLHKLNVTAEALVEERQKVLFNRLAKQQPKFMPHAKETIEFFCAKKIPFGLVTSSSRFEVDMFLKESGWANYFSSVVTRDDVVNCKPHPEPYERSVKSGGFLKSDYVVFEDSFSGVRSAKAAGLTCYAIQSHEAERNKLKDHTDLIFNNLKEATDHLLAHNTI